MQPSKPREISQELLDAVLQHIKARQPLTVASLIDAMRDRTPVLFKRDYVKGLMVRVLEILSENEQISIAYVDAYDKEKNVLYSIYGLIPRKA